MRRTRILVADSMPIFRSAVRTILTREGDFEVREAADLSALQRAVDAECPDIALIDLDLAPAGGVAAVASLSGRCDTHTIGWGFEPSGEAVVDAIRAGASGFLHKEISPRGLVRSLRGIVQGEAPLARDLAPMMIAALHGAEERDRARDRALALSAREREVLELVARGARNREIAAALGISEFTVKRHVQNILQKLALPSRRAAGGFYRSAMGSEEGTPVLPRTA